MAGKKDVLVEKPEVLGEPVPQKEQAGMVDPETLTMAAFQETAQISGLVMPMADGPLDNGSCGPDTDLYAAEHAAQKAAYLAADQERREKYALFSSLPEKYRMTALRLSVEYVRFSMEQDSALTKDELNVIELCQDQAHLMAAATLCAMGRY